MSYDEIHFVKWNEDRSDYMWTGEFQKYNDQALIILKLIGWQPIDCGNLNGRNVLLLVKGS
jgi:hypothetical protein